MCNINKTFVRCVMCFLLTAGGASLAHAQAEEYDPVNPEEPAVIPMCRLTVSADPEEGAYVSGGGSYKVGSGAKYISTSARNTEDYTYKFLYWTLDGVQCSTSPGFYYTPTEGRHTLVAHYDKEAVIFDPGNPGEPVVGVQKKMLYLESNPVDACSFNTASGVKREVGAQIYLRAYPNEFFHFERWEVNGETVSSNISFYYTMPSEATTVTAVFSEVPYDPDNPGEPAGSDSYPGDVNGDGKINVTDVGMVIDHILEHTPSGFIAEAADVNGDSKINVTDVGLIIDIILSDNSAREVLMTENVKKSVEEIHEPQ